MADKLGTVTQSVKRSASHDKAADFHSSARGMGTRDGSVQELDRLSIADDEGRLYNEHYGSEHSQEDGDRYGCLFLSFVTVGQFSYRDVYERERYISKGGSFL